MIKFKLIPSWKFSAEYSIRSVISDDVIEAWKMEDEYLKNPNTKLYLRLTPECKRLKQNLLDLILFFNYEIKLPYMDGDDEFLENYTKGITLFPEGTFNPQVDVEDPRFVVYSESECGALRTYYLSYLQDGSGKSLLRVDRPNSKYEHYFLLDKCIKIPNIKGDTNWGDEGYYNGTWRLEKTELIDLREE